MCVDHRTTVGLQTRDQLNRVVQLNQSGAKIWLCKGRDIRDEYKKVGRDVPPGTGILHEKAMLIGPFLICGSTNWTTSSRSNHELSVLVWLDEDARDEYRNRFHNLVSMGTPLTDKIIADADATREEKRQKKLKEKRRKEASSRSSAASSA